MGEGNAFSPYVALWARGLKREDACTTGGVATLDARAAINELVAQHGVNWLPSTDEELAALPLPRPRSIASRFLAACAHRGDEWFWRQACIVGVLAYGLFPVALRRVLLVATPSLWLLWRVRGADAGHARWLGYVNALVFFASFVGAEALSLLDLVTAPCMGCGTPQSSQTFCCETGQLEWKGSSVTQRWDMRASHDVQAPLSLRAALPIVLIFALALWILWRMRRLAARLLHRATRLSSFSVFVAYPQGQIDEPLGQIMILAVAYFYFKHNYFAAVAFADAGTPILVCTGDGHRETVVLGAAHAMPMWKIILEAVVLLLAVMQAGEFLTLALKDAHDVLKHYHAGAAARHTIRRRGLANQEGDEGVTDAWYEVVLRLDADELENGCQQMEAALALVCEAEAARSNPVQGGCAGCRCGKRGGEDVRRFGNLEQQSDLALGILIGHLLWIRAAEMERKQQPVADVAGAIKGALRKLYGHFFAKGGVKSGRTA